MTQTDDDATLPAFAQLGLPEPLTRATDELGFARTTEIQALTLPHIVAGRDVAAQAQTGTGKTAAFLLGSFARLLEREAGDARRANQPRMLVIAPTRELAIQIDKDAQGLGRHTGLKSMVVYGGIDYDKQRTELAEGVDVLIGTPGRLIDYFKQKVFDLEAIEIVVLDEADRMFDLGFIADIRFLLRRMPPPAKRTSMLFSATLSHRVMELAFEHMNDPEQIKTGTESVTADRVVQSLYQPASDEKIPLLLGLLRDLEPERSMVFVNTKRAAERIENYLVGNGVTCGLLSGDVRQNKRQKILADFTAGAIPVLIATDVAARGLHIEGVTHVFNYDLPQQAEDYVHRIGRTARAGTAGVAVSFACENYSFSLPEIQEYIGQSIPLVHITDELLVTPKRPARIERDRVERPGERRGGPPGRGEGRGEGRGQGRASGRWRPRARPGTWPGSRSGPGTGSGGRRGARRVDRRGPKPPNAAGAAPTPAAADASEPPDRTARPRAGREAPPPRTPEAADRPRRGGRRTTRRRAVRTRRPRGRCGPLAPPPTSGPGPAAGHRRRADRRHRPPTRSTAAPARPIVRPPPAPTTECRRWPILRRSPFPAPDGPATMNLDEARSNMIEQQVRHLGGARPASARRARHSCRARQFVEPEPPGHRLQRLRAADRPRPADAQAGAGRAHPAGDRARPDRVGRRDRHRQRLPERVPGPARSPRRHARDRAGAGRRSGRAPGPPRDRRTCACTPATRRAARTRSARPRPAPARTIRPRRGAGTRSCSAARSARSRPRGRSASRRAAACSRSSAIRPRRRWRRGC